MTKDMQHQQALRKALHLLSLREHSAHELRQKLGKFDLKVIGETLKTLQDQDYQNDLRFAESLIHSYIDKGKGSLRILNELKYHQLEPDIIKQTMDDIDDHTWKDLCYQVWQKKFSHQQNLNEFKNRQKQKQFLAMRGFISDHWRHFLK